ncbi:MAG: tRNA 2-thiouridine(34) synthase MnmA [Desulfobacterales bacterium]|nr:tRNA 2-thiouridine(34) synthase MnmA [Desulfobacterales bacterium]
MLSHTAIAMSGGIDSLVAAAILKEQGQSLLALHFLNGYESGVSPRTLGDAEANGEGQARRALQPLADRLGIPLFIIDLRAEFQKHVVDYFVTTYGSGKTPNPCLVCNPMIKFDVLMAKAKELGADRMATGHYARIEMAEDGRRRLLRGVDSQKEQSYFLSRLTQRQLAMALLPLGGMTKEQTRHFARRRGLAPATAQESQDVCFIKSGNYGDFLAQQPRFVPQAGTIEDLRGRVIGHHQGLHGFTIGQRRGINCPAAEPYYVVRLEPQRNRLIVGTKNDLLTSKCRVDQINWIAPPPQGSLQVMTRVRYRHQAVRSRLIPLGADRAELLFENPEAAVTPGQGAVFYAGEEVLGGGWIE